jgi:hypothetical protein
LLPLSLNGFLGRGIQRDFPQSVQLLELVLGRLGAVVSRRHAAEPN